jgi:prepilin-type N-terminal cleavage/methylation domain-containing protein
MRVRAFSLIEVMVAVAIVGVIAALGVPSVVSLVATGRARETAQGIAAVLEEARTSAAAEGRCFRVRINGPGTNGNGLQIERRNSVDCVHVTLGAPDGWDAPKRTQSFDTTNLTITSTLPSGSQNEIIFRPNDRLRGDGNLPTDAAHQGYGARIKATLKNGRFAVVDITAQGRICTRISTTNPPAQAAPVVCP